MLMNAKTERITNLLNDYVELSEDEALDLTLGNNKWIIEIIEDNEYEENDYKEN